MVWLPVGYFIDFGFLTLHTIEWLYVISGHGRATAFAGGSAAKTFDLQTGDSAVFPIAYGHYVRVFRSLPNFDLTRMLVDQKHFPHRSVDFHRGV